MDGSAQQFEALLAIDAQQDDILRRLDDLDTRLARVLAECSGKAARGDSGRDSDSAAGPDKG
jgi:hypothetical protein